MFPLFFYIMADFTHYAFCNKFIKMFHIFFVFAILKEAFIVISYNYATNLRPSCIIIYNYTNCLMIAESSNLKVVCGLA